MQHLVSLQVSVKEAALCALDKDGRIVHRALMDSDPRVIIECLLSLGYEVSRIGHEAGPLSPWL